MPIYEYRRPDGTTFEVRQSFSEDPLTHDPETGVEVTRVLHAPAVHFKGSGFYNTDYGTRKRQRENAASSESSDSAKESSGSGEGKSKESSSSPEKAASEKKSEKKPAAGSAGGSEGAKKAPSPAGA